MNYNDCILFLRNNQPLPPTDSISEDTLNYFNKVLNYLQINPSIESIPLLLNSFGEGDGHGVYSMVENIIAMHPKETVIPYLLQALNNKKGSIKFWCAEIAAIFPDPILFPHLRDIYLNGNEDERDAALFSISLINSNQSIEFLNKLKKDQK